MVEREEAARGRLARAAEAVGHVVLAAAEGLAAHLPADRDVLGVGASLEDEAEAKKAAPSCRARPPFCRAPAPSCCLLLDPEIGIELS